MGSPRNLGLETKWTFLEACKTQNCLWFGCFAFVHHSNFYLVALAEVHLAVTSSWKVALPRESAGCTFHLLQMLSQAEISESSPSPIYIKVHNKAGAESLRSLVGRALRARSRSRCVASAWPCFRRKEAYFSHTDFSWRKRFSIVWYNSSACWKERVGLDHTFTTKPCRFKTLILRLGVSEHLWHKSKHQCIFAHCQS